VGAGLVTAIPRQERWDIYLHRSNRETLQSARGKSTKGARMSICLRFILRTRAKGRYFAQAQWIVELESFYAARAFRRVKHIAQGGLP
jgi:hypothetical protein